MAVVGRGREEPGVGQLTVPLSPSQFPLLSTGPPGESYPFSLLLTAQGEIACTTQT